MTTFLLLFGLTLCVLKFPSSTHGQAAYSICLDGWLAFNGSCYLLAHGDVKLTFTGAEHFCRQHINSHLVHVNDALENAFIKDHLRNLKPNNWWMGITDEDIEGVWKWFDTDKVASFTDWQPNDHTHNNEDCAVFAVGDDFKWVDTYCTHNSYLYTPICETPSRSCEEELVVG
ncbi:C-type lectin-like [Mya arenaria]|uniref:C-type lectin-like n=1 Tax=Mya arenaria TaxID=6604 RepID=UPI0022E53F61|nr:C-type lectin-like [Mya arenaria]